MSTCLKTRVAPWRNAITDRRSEPLRDWLAKQFEGHQFAPSQQAQRELADLAKWYVGVYFGKPRPLRRAAVAKKLRTLARNLDRAAKAASELGSLHSACVHQAMTAR